MNKLKIVYLMVIALAVSLVAQERFKINLLHENNSAVEVKSGIDSLKILAIMVQFQPDLYDATIGNGRFGTIYSAQTATRSDILDPLPHNKPYFEEHLEFVKNYFEKNSAGKLNVAYFVADNIITLGYTMRHYSPEVGSDDLSGMISMTQESWQKFASQNPGFDFSKYNMFVIFHAGVGRDVTLPGSLGLERDLPSVYFSLSGMRYYLGASFNGIEVGNNFRITNSAILPETESRESATIVGTQLYQLTINGLATSMVGSFLGLPDLYNTETGYSAIGRFGLMDGQSIFAYGGAFPPAPSPIEKMWLGWIEPKEVYLQNKKIDLTTYVKAVAGDTALVKIPINSREYFLIENRNRDANNNGAIITYKIAGRSYTLALTNDTTGFNNYDVDTLRGVVTDVDEFDWALPGNGIVIWHIDENVIDANRASNTINNDKNHKGVAVMEADGIQDIGEKFTTIFGDTFIGEGEPNDFWFAGNSGHYFTDEFSPSSKPSSNSYSRANSGIYLTNFSSIGNNMSFNVRFAFDEFALKKVIRLPNGGNIDFINSALSSETKCLTVKSGKTIYVYDNAGELKYTLPEFSESRNLILNYGKTYIVGNIGNKVNIFSFDENTSLRDSMIIPGEITSPFCGLHDRLSEFQFGVTNGNSSRVYNADFFTGVWDTSSIAVSGKITQLIYAFQIRLAVTKNSVYSLSTKNEFGNSGYTSENEIIQAGLANIMADSDSGRKIVLLEKNNLVEVIDYPSFEKFSSFYIEANAQVENFSLLSFSYRSFPYINFSVDGKNFFYNLEGFQADNSPLEDSERIGFSGSDIFFTTKTGKSYLISSSTDGRLFFFDKNEMNSRLSSFFTVGNQLIQSPVLLPDNDSTKLVVANKSNNIYLFNYSEQIDLNRPYWSGDFSGGANNMTLDGLIYYPESNTNFKLIEAYNWPNPVYGATTNFRFKVNEDSEVKIVIFDMAGTKVAELNGRGRKDFESEIAWDVSNVQSDIYFAHLEATGINSHKTESKLIKVAIVK